MIKRFEKRADLNDAQAIQSLGVYYSHGMYGLQQDYTKALELWHRAAELGNADAYYRIGFMYDFGRGGVERDEKKAKHYYEQSAVRGNAAARCNLGEIEEEAGNTDRAYIDGVATKDDYEIALRTYRAYLDEIRSEQRDEAAASREEYRYYESAF